MPTPEVFETEVRALGVNQRSQIVVYDRIGIFSSPRAWWMFKAMGHDAVAVLDGGLPAWVAAGLPTESTPRPTVPTGDFVAKPRPSFFVDAEHVATALANPAAAVLDARSEGRFHGRDPEPRQGLRGGHMPNAVNVPFGSVQDRGHMKSPEELSALLAAKVGARERLVFSCGSGVTACTLALAAELAGYSNKAVYDGSWSEWGLPSARRVVTD
jgi:thiosulfate/3-mercaptopyruvate sulfurtransferase